MTERRQLRDVSHTNPYTGNPFGDTQTYGRGRVVAADGGEREAVDPASDSDAEPVDAEPVDSADDSVESDGGAADTLGEVDHTPPGNAPSANGAYDRTDGNDV